MVKSRKDHHHSVGVRCRQCIAEHYRLLKVIRETTAGQLNRKKMVTSLKRLAKKEGWRNYE
jgi:hypothetical protein